jgi:hypothetical protein
VLLEFCQVGGQRFTSREAIARFIQRLTNGGTPTPTAAARNTKSVEAAVRFLDAEGVGASPAREHRPETTKAKRR